MSRLTMERAAADRVMRWVVLAIAAATVFAAGAGVTP